MAGRRTGWLLFLLACASKPEGIAPPVSTPPPPPSLFDPLSYEVPAAPRLAFEARHEPLRSQFLRQGPVAVHFLVRSGERPRVLAAFPAGDAGIGIWFRPAAAGTQLSFAGDVAGSALGALTREGGAHPLRGARTILRSTATRLTSELVLLGSARSLRDYERGECLEDASRFPELRNESFELEPQHRGLRVRRLEIGGAFSLELLLAGLSGTTIELRQREGGARPGCSAGAQPVIELTGERGIELSMIALASDEPLTPVEPRELLTATPVALQDAWALAFLSYREKLVAGSWRFLTYFGRDTLLSLWMLLPALTQEVARQALGSVLERVQLEPGARDPDGGVVEPGDVAHEEEIGDYAAWKNQRLSPRPPDLRAPRYDYRMIDDDFLLAPALAAVAEQRAAGRGGRKARTTLEALLGERRGDGRTFEQAALANLELVLRRARPFADDPRAPADKKERLVALREGQAVGQWRDSAMGLAFGRYPFDVNAALVPAALAAAQTLYTLLGRAAEAAEAERLARAWQGVEELFRFELPLDTARANVSSYAAAVGLADVAGTLQDDGDGRVVEYAIALDAQRSPLPVQHSDHGFVLAFGQPSQEYLRHVATRLARPFPAGLLSPVGVMVANPAFAAPDFSVVDPRRLEDASDDVRRPLRDLFTSTHYHGAVVWSWQQALLAAGLRRQLARRDLAPVTRSALAAAECELWHAIDATRALRAGELWSWAARDGRAELRPFGAGRADADESNAIQLWSTVYLAVQKPAPMASTCNEPMPAPVPAAAASPAPGSATAIDRPAHQ